MTILHREFIAIALRLFRKPNTVSVIRTNMIAPINDLYIAHFVMVAR